MFMVFMHVTLMLSIMVLFIVALNETLMPNVTGLIESVSTTDPGRWSCVMLTKRATYDIENRHTSNVKSKIKISVSGTALFMVNSLSNVVVRSINAISSVPTLKCVLTYLFRTPETR